MQRSKRRRVACVQDALHLLPLRRDVVVRETARFVETGTLPDNQRLAVAVVDRVLRPLTEPEEGATVPDPPRLSVVVVTQAELERGGPGPTRRECLLGEAVHGEGMVRFAARSALELEVRFGADVTDPSWLADRTMPRIATVGMDLLGFPERLAKAPYEEQAHRLFDRIAELRERVEPQDEAWSREQAEALVAFLMGGDLPTDDLIRDAVLVDVEVACLVSHARGRDVAARMALLDRIGTSRGASREAAICDLQQHIRNRRRTR